MKAVKRASPASECVSVRCPSKGCRVWARKAKGETFQAFARRLVPDAVLSAIVNPLIWDSLASRSGSIAPSIAPRVAAPTTSRLGCTPTIINNPAGKVRLAIPPMRCVGPVMRSGYWLWYSAWLPLAYPNAFDESRQSWGGDPIRGFLRASLECGVFPRRDARG